MNEDESMPMDEQIRLAIKSGPGSLPYEMWRDVIENPEAALKSMHGIASATDAGTPNGTYE